MSGVSCLEQTADGYLWVGTRAGLARFDGIRFEVFDEKNTFLHPTITALVEDAKDGTLWIGSERYHEGTRTPEGSLAVYRQGQFQRVTHQDGLPPGPIKRLAKCWDGGVWVQAGDTLAKAEDGKVVRVVRNQLFASDAIVYLSCARDGWLEIFTERAWLRLSPNENATNPVRKTVEPAIAPEWRRACVASNHFNAWVGTARGVFEINNGSSRQVHQEGLGTAEINLIYLNNRGDVWVNAQERDLWHWNGSTWQTEHFGEGYERGSATAMLEDDEGSLWIGAEQGLFQRRRLPIRTLTTEDGLPHPNVWSVCQATDGAIWVGTKRGVARISDGVIQHWKGIEPLEDDWDRCVWPTARGGVFIAKRNDCSILEATPDGVFSTRVPGTQVPHPVSALWSDDPNTLAIATPEGVHVYCDQWPGFPLQHLQTYAAPDVTMIFRDRQGSLWFATEGRGLQQVLATNFVPYLNESKVLTNNILFAIHEDQEGVFWLATDLGVSRFKDRKFFNFSKEHGLVEGTINWIMEDDLGFLWFSSLQGLHRASRREMNDIASGKRANTTVLSFGMADGLENPESNGEAQPAGCKDRFGRLWFPIIRGVAVVDPRDLQGVEGVPRVVLESVHTNNVLVAGAGLPSSRGVSLRLTPGSGDIVEFTYTAPTYVDPRHVRFRHRLKGVSEWNETADRVARYLHLKPGEYDFEVVPISHKGVVGANSASISFVVEPFFWQTWPFYLLCGGILVGTIGILQGYRIRWRHRLDRLERQRSLEAERARIARDLHDDLGTALTGLALELDVVRRDTTSPPDANERLDHAAQLTRDLADRMREVVWMVNPRCDNILSLAGFLEQQINRFLSARGIRIRLDFPDDIPPLNLPAEPRHQLALCVREALANVVRHSNASETTIKLQVHDSSLVVCVSDNGRGFDQCTNPGHGLANMRERMHQIGGTFECVTTPGNGATLTFTLPLSNQPKFGL